MNYDTWKATEPPESQEICNRCERMPVHGLSWLCESCQEDERRKEQWVDESDRVLAWALRTN